MKDIVWKWKNGQFTDEGAMSYRIKGLGEVKCNYVYVLIGLEEACEVVEKIDKSSRSGPSWPECELVIEHVRVVWVNKDWV